MNKKYPPIVFSEQYGGEDASRVVHPIVFALKKLSKELVKDHYGPMIESLSFIFRVDGSVVKYNFTGCELPKIESREHAATIDLGITIDLWNNRTTDEIKQYIATVVRQGHSELTALLKAKKVDFDHERAARDIDELVKQFLSRE